MLDSRPGQQPPGIVEPFYFGEPALYGCLHPGPGSHRGAVICYPFGHEYITIHRAARQLATQISRAGLPTLRFDYSGTGDSAGDLEEARLGQWRRDIESAVDELRSRTGVERVSLVCIRLGASLALQASVDRDDVESLALWDPVVWGKTYLRELGHDTRRMLRIAHVVPGNKKPGVKGKSRLELVGFPVADRLASDLRGLELDQVEPPRAERILLLESRRAAGAPLGAALRTAGCQVETRTEVLPHLWRWSEDITKVQLPHSQVRALAGWVAEGSP